jgi:hypothetical protein
MEHDQLIPWRQFLSIYLHISPTTGWRREHADPEFRALKVQTGPGRFGARLSCIQKYIASRPAATPLPTPTKALAAAQKARAERRADQKEGALETR